MVNFRNFVFGIALLPVFGFAVAFDCNACIIEDGDGQTYLIYGGHEYFIEKMHHCHKCRCRYNENLSEID